MKIQELERRTGLERPSIRFYEKEDWHLLHTVHGKEQANHPDLN